METLPPSEGPISAASITAATAAPCSCSCWGRRKGKDNDPLYKTSSYVWAWLLAVGAVAIYLALALNGGAVSLLLRLNRWGGPGDIYPRARAVHGRAYALRPFQEMFWPSYVAGHGGPRRSLAVFTAGQDGLQNVDKLVTTWGDTHFDYLVCHYDESQAAWAALPWYKHAVGFYAHRQGKMWFFKRALTPWLVQVCVYRMCICVYACVRMYALVM